MTVNKTSLFILSALVINLVGVISVYLNATDSRTELVALVSTVLVGSSILYFAADFLPSSD